MLNYISIVVYSLPAIYIINKLVWYFSTLSQSQNFTKSSPIPSVTIYSRRDDVVFWLLSPKLAPIIKLLPFGWGKWVQYVQKDFHWIYRLKPHTEKLGSDIYWIAAPGGSTLIVCDADVIAQMTHRWKDFPKPVHAYRALNILGPNVVTTEGADWQRHRKITSPPFNERNSSLVFKETLAQAKSMLASFTSDPEGKASPGQEPVVEDLVRWTMMIALNVISGAAFGMNMTWSTTSVAAPDVHTIRDNQEQVTHLERSRSKNKHTIPFQESVESLITYVPFLIFFPIRVLRNSPFKVMRQMAQSSDEFVSYLRELISAAEHPAIKIMKNKVGESISTKGDLLGNIIKASSENRNIALNEEETIGNMFIFMIAGHETTATTMQAALILLACHPDVRQSVQEEIDGIWASKNDGEDLTYDDYPKMRTLMALMLETLRLYPIASGLPKSTDSAQTIIYRNQIIDIPANTSIQIDLVTVQRSPRSWGSDSHSFRPSRWLMPADYIPPPNTTNESAAHTSLLCPPKGAFVAFSTGFRACLGKKFAQVEFCTAIAVLMKDHSVELVREGEQDWETVREKAFKTLDHRNTGVAMRMHGKVKVRFVKRGKEMFPSMW